MVIEIAAVAALLAGLLGVADTVPYLRDTIRRSTVPHRSTWLIWSVIEVVAVQAHIADGARWSLAPLIIQAVGSCLILGLSVRLGSGGLSRIDLALIALAGVGVAGWLAVDTPMVATVCVIAADLIAAVMMLPKTWRAPETETLSTFVLAAVGGALTVGAVGSMSVALLVYPVYFFLVNAALALVIAYRRRLLGHGRRTRSTVPTLALVPATLEAGLE